LTDLLKLTLVSMQYLKESGSCEVMLQTLVHPQWKCDIF